MILPTAEQILSNLPFFLTVWTSLTISCGVYMLVAYTTMMKYDDQHKGGRHQTDVYNAQFIKGSIIVLALALIFGPVIVNYSDILIVANVFINGVFALQLGMLSRWWKQKPSDQLTSHVE